MCSVGTSSSIITATVETPVSPVVSPAGEAASADAATLASNPFAALEGVVGGAPEGESPKSASAPKAAGRNSADPAEAGPPQVPPGFVREEYDRRQHKGWRMMVPFWLTDDRKMQRFTFAGGELLDWYQKDGSSARGRSMGNPETFLSNGGKILVDPLGRRILWAFGKMGADGNPPFFLRFFAAGKTPSVGKSFLSYTASKSNKDDVTRKYTAYLLDGMKKGQHVEVTDEGVWQFQTARPRLFRPKQAGKSPAPAADPASAAEVVKTPASTVTLAPAPKKSAWGKPVVSAPAEPAAAAAGPAEATPADDEGEFTVVGSKASADATSSERHAIERGHKLFVDGKTGKFRISTGYKANRIVTLAELKKLGFVLFRLPPLGGGVRHAILKGSDDREEFALRKSLLLRTALKTDLEIGSEEQKAVAREMLASSTVFSVKVKGSGYVWRTTFVRDEAATPSPVVPEDFPEMPSDPALAAANAERSKKFEAESRRMEAEAAAARTADAEASTVNVQPEAAEVAPAVPEHIRKDLEQRLQVPEGATRVMSKKDRDEGALVLGGAAGSSA